MKMFGKFVFALVAAFCIHIGLALLMPSYGFINAFIATPAGFAVIFMAAFCELNFATL